MARNLFKGLLIGVVMATVGLVCVDESRAFLGLCNRAQPTTALSPVCNPCAQQMTCNYVPQTSYRVQYVSVPVTTYRPLMTCDPCGCQTTCMRPETTYVQRAQYVPYTSYKMVYTMARPACATTTYYAATAAAVAPPSGCSTCGVAGAQQATYYGTTAVGTMGAVGATGVAPQVAAPVAVNYQPNYAYSSGYGAGSTMYPYGQPTIGTPGAIVAPAPVQRVIVQPTPTAVVTPGMSSMAPSYSGQTYVSPNGGAMVQPSLPTTTTSYYGTTQQGTIVQQGAIVTMPPTQTQIIQSAPPAGQTVIMQSAPPAGVSPTLAPPTAGESTTVAKPIEIEKRTEIKVETESTDKMTPIPDPLMNQQDGPSLNKKTSSPRLYDPQDKTAAVWPTERAWGYAAVGTTIAARTRVAAEPAPIVLTSAIVPGAITSTHAAPVISAERNSATLGPIVPMQSTNAAPMNAVPTRDADGWRSSGR